jgi:DNA-binding transcriptional ArsR family regulator
MLRNEASRVSSSSRPSSSSSAAEASMEDPCYGNVDVDALKRELLELICREPGVRYSELARLTGIAYGTLSFHLSRLVKKGYVKVHKRVGMTRYYPLDVSEDEFALMDMLKNASMRKIILFLIGKESCTFKEIVDYMGRSPSTISERLGRLKDANLITVRTDGGSMQKTFRLSNKQAIKEHLDKHKKSFADKVVDNYTEMIEGL